VALNQTRLLPETLPLSRPFIGACLVAVTFLLSAIVSSEPAPADALMLGLIIALPMLGLLSFGRFTVFQGTLWVIITASSLVAAAQLEAPGDAIKHQLVTLFLVAGAMTIAGYIRAWPEERFHLIMACFVLSMTAASFFAIVGKLGLIPGTAELFTLHGRGRGTFKDPNVLGAAIVPAIAYLFWMVMRKKEVPLAICGTIGAILTLGLFLSFSRGAWIATAICVVVLCAILSASSRRKSDIKRWNLALICGGVLVAGGLIATLQNEAVRDMLQERASFSQSYDQGPHGRFAGQAKAVDLIIENPLGIGAKVFAPTYHHEQPHQVYLSMFLNAGWLGGFCFLISMVTTLVVGLRASLRRDRYQGVALVSTAAFFAMAVEGAIIDSDHWRHLFMLMGLIWGLTDANPPKVDRSKRRTDWSRESD
jgi:hypothetical protein